MYVWFACLCAFTKVMCVMQCVRMAEHAHTSALTGSWELGIMALTHSTTTVALCAMNQVKRKGLANIKEW